MNRDQHHSVISGLSSVSSGVGWPGLNNSPRNRFRSLGKHDRLEPIMDKSEASSVFDILIRTNQILVQS